MTGRGGTPMAKAWNAIRTGGMAALILAWAVGGEVKLLAVVLLALFLVHHVIALAAAFVAYAAIELAFCTWIERHWDGWEAKAGSRMRKKIDKWRSGRVMRHVADWITGGTEVVYGIDSLIAHAQRPETRPRTRPLDMPGRRDRVHHLRRLRHLRDPRNRTRSVGVEPAVEDDLSQKY